MRQFASNKNRKPQTSEAEEMITIRNNTTLKEERISKALWKEKAEKWSGKFSVVKPVKVKEPPEVAQLQEKKAAAKKQGRKKTDTVSDENKSE